MTLKDVFVSCLNFVCYFTRFQVTQFKTIFQSESSTYINVISKMPLFAFFSADQLDIDDLKFFWPLRRVRLHRPPPRHHGDRVLSQVLSFFRQTNRTDVSFVQDRSAKLQNGDVETVGLRRELVEGMHVNSKHRIRLPRQRFHIGVKRIFSKVNSDSCGREFSKLFRHRMDAMSGCDDMLSSDQSSSASGRSDLNESLPRINSESGFGSSDNSSPSNGRSSAEGFVDDWSVLYFWRFVDDVCRENFVPRIHLSSFGNRLAAVITANLNINKMYFLAYFWIIHIFSLEQIIIEQII